MKRSWNSLLKPFKVNSSRIYLDQFAKAAANSVVANARVLDAGSGLSPYRQYFSHVKYKTADFAQVDKAYAKIDYVCDLKNIPVESEYFDLILMTQVLEHLPEPYLVLKELNRITKPGGSIWISAPLYFPEHEIPYDFYRYTQFGLSYLIEKAGFEIDRIDWLEGYYGTLSRQFLIAARSLPTHPRQYGGGFWGWLLALSAYITKPAYAILSSIYTRMDLRYKYTETGHCKNYTVIAFKGNSTETKEA